jgi:methylated-DNA-[protein]-cysteine S-methyltransferase
MDTPGFHLFDTHIGRCGIAWNERGVVCLQLPERTDAATCARLQRKSGGVQEAEPPASVRAAITAIRELMQGAPHDLRDIELDMQDVPELARRVYRAARLIPPGETQTYGEVARRIGSPGSARAVGRALGANPFAIIVPCHRVLAAGGGSGGFSAHGGVETKWKMLEIERGTRSDQLPLPLSVAREPR